MGIAPGFTAELLNPCGLILTLGRNNHLAEGGWIVKYDFG